MSAVLDQPAAERDREDAPGGGNGRIAMTHTAAAKVKALIERERRPATAGLRVAVVTGGCSGFQYSLGLADTPSGDDVVHEQDGVRLFVDRESSQYLGGTTLDYVDGLHGAGFRFVNPNADRTCGCGSSFSV